jgi:hypothetical protein
MKDSFSNANCPLLQFYQSGNRAQIDLSDTGNWELLIRQARHANLLSRLALTLEPQAINNDLDQKPRQHLENAIRVSDANTRAARWEITNIYDLLHTNDIPFILLKGCAYLWTGNDASRGRLFGDTDIMVRKPDLHQAEVLFTHNGWVTTKLDSYDQKYYRDWMHELPPLHHTTRHTSLDLHHDILPPISKAAFDIETFWSQAIEDCQHLGLFTLAPIDMILHSAAHLFHEGEFEQGFRDLVDLDALITEYINDEKDWQALQSRAQEVNLSVYVYYALECCRRILRTSVNEPVLNGLREAAGISSSRARLMTWLLCTAIIPDHKTMQPPGSGFARQILLLRSHYIKMPWYLLLWHLYKKSSRNLKYQPKNSKRNYTTD